MSACRSSLQVSNSLNTEGLKTARLLMVLSSISPLFIVWAIRGNRLIPDGYFVSFCALMVLAPNAFLWVRIQTAKGLRKTRDAAIRWSLLKGHRSASKRAVVESWMPKATDEHED